MGEPGVHAEFYLQPVLHGARSHAEGRQVFVDKTFIRIRVVGQRDVMERQADDNDRARFPAEWAAWENKQTAPRVGTPVTEWPALSPSQVRNLEALNIFTVEDMASTSDMALQKLGMGARELQEKAKRFLAGNSRANELDAQVQTQQKTIDAQAAALAQLEARLAEFLAGQQPAKADPRPQAAGKKPAAGMQ